MTEHELQNPDGTMPVTCCTIIAWSCASLRVFRPQLFALLGQVASSNLNSCQSYEVTNLLWAFAELCKQQPQMVESVETTIHLVCDAAAQVFQNRSRSAWKFPVLVSALVSLSALPLHSSQTSLLIVISRELAMKESDARPQQRVPLVQAFDAISMKHPEAGTVVRLG